MLASGTSTPKLRNRDPRSVWSALAALAAVGCAAWAQALLEQVRRTDTAPSHLAGPLFLIAAALAIAATWNAPPPDSTQRLRIIVPSWRWLAAACLPAIAALVGAACLHSDRLCQMSCNVRAHVLWYGAIVWLLVVGAVECAARSRPWRRPDFSRLLRTLLSVALLVAVAVAMRCALGVENFPPFIESDEANQALEARGAFGSPYGVFDTYWVGIPVMSAFLTRLAELAFGDSLWGVRMGGVALGVISVLCLFGLARRLTGDGIALLAAFLLAVAHTHVHWSRNGQHYIQTAAAAAVVLWFFARVWTGGSLLSWVAAGIGLGIGTQTYQASFILPPLVGATAIGWGFTSRQNARAAVVSTSTIVGIAALLLLPVVTTMSWDWKVATNRSESLFTFSDTNIHLLEQSFGTQSAAEAVFDHGLRSALIFNRAAGFFSHYAARRSLVDEVSAAIVPLAFAMLLVRIFTPLGWMCWLWAVAYWTVGVFLCAHPPSYHRIAALLLFSSLAVAWAAVTLLRTVVAGLRLPRASAAAGAVAFGAAVAWANIDFYYREYRADTPMNHGFALMRIICKYADTDAVVNATIIDGFEYVPPQDPLEQLECPRTRRVRRTESAHLWEIDDVTGAAPRAVLVVPKVVVDQHPGTPQGYRITRQYIDDSIHSPTDLPLAVYELERES